MGHRMRSWNLMERKDGGYSMTLRAVKIFVTTNVWS